MSPSNFMNPADVKSGAIKALMGAAVMTAALGLGATAGYAAAPAPADAPAMADGPGAMPGPRGMIRERMRERMQERMEGRGENRMERGAEIDRHLTPEQVRDIVAGRLALAGNANLKVGKVTAKEDGVVAVEIVTKTGALVDTREISTKSGGPARLAEAMAGGRPGMGPEGMGPGRMGPGRMEPGRMGPGRNGPARDLKLTVDQVKKLAEARLILQGNPRLKLGAVKEKDADTITVDIVAADNSLVTQREIDRHTGRGKRG